MSCIKCGTHLHPDEHGDCRECGAAYDEVNKEVRISGQRQGETEGSGGAQEEALREEDSTEKQLNFFGRENRRSRRAA
jgi:DNA-directed RNA polymerase subunit M/transcription elongation factor TFIIS